MISKTFWCSITISHLVVMGALLYMPAGAAQDTTTTTRILEVEWPENYDGAFAPIPEPALQSINTTLLPILIPSSFLKFKSLNFVGEDLHYTASVRAHGAKLAITGTRIATDLPNAHKLPLQTSSQATAELDEGIVQVPLQKYGASYLVTIECEKHTDTRCTDDKYIMELLMTATFMGGSKASPNIAIDQGLQNGAAAPIPGSVSVGDLKFKWQPPGDLISGSGIGVKDSTVFAPGIRFPIEKWPAYLNSQVWNRGGQHGGGGRWSDKGNYKYPWRDNFCEKRSRPTPVCPSGNGHQGVDIRPTDSKDTTYWAVASENGRISNVGIYSVTLTGDSGTQYRYLHLKMSKLKIKQGERVSRGQKIGLVSNDFNGTPTPVHLHFEILQNLSGRGIRHVPPYMSLVRAYEKFD